LRSHDETFLLKVLQDFRRFRYEPGHEMEAQQLTVKPEDRPLLTGFLTPNRAEPRRHNPVPR
jgi:hypothetical protein